MLKKPLVAALPAVLIAVFLRIAAAAGAGGGEFTPFGEVTVSPDMVLNGDGQEVDSLAFWEAPDPADTLMFVTGKDNNVVEVWKFPFQKKVWKLIVHNNELDHISVPHAVNGADVDQGLDKLFISGGARVSRYSLPELSLEQTFGQEYIQSKSHNENNMDVLERPDGAHWLYVTAEDLVIHYFNPTTGAHLGQWSVSGYVNSIEEVLADPYYQYIIVPEEQGEDGVSGSALYAFTPTGQEYYNPNAVDPTTNKFGNGLWDGDEEGILLYTCPSDGSSDDGRGFIVQTDQIESSRNGFLFFDRRTWKYLGTLRLSGIENTDGIASTQKALDGYPLGLFAAIDDDAAAAVVSWQKILQAAGLSC